MPVPFWAGLPVGVVPGDRWRGSKLARILRVLIWVLLVCSSSAVEAA